MAYLKKGVKVFAPLWLLLITVLFFLPGSALPSEGLFDLPYFDKVVHVSFFAVLLFSWRFFFGHTAKVTWLLLGLALCYGVAVEIIQHYFVANRSFDLLDIVADLLGSVAGLLVWSRYIKK